MAPTGAQRFVHPEGELAVARGAAAANATLCISSSASMKVEDIARAATGPVWFQLYVYRDRAATEGLIRRVEAAGCQALVLTVDAPLLGRRERDVRNRFHLPPGLAVENMTAEGHGAVDLQHAESCLAAYVAAKLDPSLGWKDVAWLRSITKLPVLVKGLVRPDDACRAIDHGASGVVVSNHGGRQLDGAPATASVLGAIADAVQGRIEVLVDGGVRRGADVLRALALGARAVLLGRPILWGLAVAGEEGAFGVLDTMREELDQAMALAGCAHVGEATRELVAR